MGYNVKAWLSGKFLGTGKKDRKSQRGVSSYVKPKGMVTKKLDEAGDIRPAAPRRGDSDDDYDTYTEDRNVEPEDD